MNIEVVYLRTLFFLIQKLLSRPDIIPGNTNNYVNSIPQLPTHATIQKLEINQFSIVFQIIYSPSWPSSSIWKLQHDISSVDVVGMMGWKPQPLKVCYIMKNRRKNALEKGQLEENLMEVGQLEETAEERPFGPWVSTRATCQL